MPVRYPVLLLAIGLLAALTSGCTTAARVASLERRARAHLEAGQRQVQPDGPQEALDLDAYRPADASTVQTPTNLDLRQALELAARHSRDYQTMKERLFSAAIALVVEDHRWDWDLSNSLNGALGRDLGAQQSTAQAGAGFSPGHQLASGGRLSANLAVTCLRYLTGGHGVDIASTASVTLTQPLLAGAGPLVAREGLTQSERNLVYALRSYVRERKGLLIQVARSYYNVLEAQDAVEVAQRSSDTLRASRERSELTSKAGRLPEFQVDQARQDELSARATLISRQQALDANRDSFRQLLGLPLTAPADVDRRELARLAASRLPRLPGTREEAVAQALAARLDLATTRQELEDAERAVRIARNGLLPKLDLTLSANAASPTAGRLHGVEWDRGSYGAGLDTGIPFDKTGETATYRRALIAHDQAQRALGQKQDQVTSELRTDWRNLEAAAENHQIQQVSLELARRRVESTELLFQAGRVNMRDVLEARDALTRTENAVTQALVTHRLTWLQLLYDLEQLPAEAETLWSPALDLAPAAAAQPKDAPTP